MSSQKTLEYPLTENEMEQDKVEERYSPPPP